MMNNILIISSFLFLTLYSGPLFISFNAMLPFIIIVLLIIIYMFDNTRFSTELYFSNNFDKITINSNDYSFENINYFFKAKKINKTTKLAKNLETHYHLSETFNKVLKDTKSKEFINNILKTVYAECYPTGEYAQIVLKSKESLEFFKTQITRYIIFREFTKVERVALLYALEGDKEVVISTHLEIDAGPNQEEVIDFTNSLSTAAKFASELTYPSSGSKKYFFIDKMPLPKDDASKAMWYLTLFTYKSMLLAELAHDLEDNKKKYIIKRTKPQELLYFPWNDLNYKRDAVVRDDLHEWSEERIWGPKFLDFFLYQFYSHTDMKFCMDGLAILEENFKDRTPKTPIKNMFRRPPCLFDWNTGLLIVRNLEREFIFEYMKSKGLVFPHVTVSEFIDLWENEEDPYYRNLLKTDEYKNIYNYTIDTTY